MEAVTHGAALGSFEITRKEQSVRLGCGCSGAAGEAVWDVECRLWMRHIPFPRDQLRVGPGVIYLNLSDHYLYCSILGLL